MPGGSYGSACVYTLGGIDPRSNRRFVHYETIGGGAGATAAAPGAHGIRVHMGNTMNLPIENVEAQIPVRFTEYSIVRESGGDGQHAGGCGVRKSLVSLADGVQASVLGERTDTPARGAAGAQDGSCARFRLVRGGQCTELGAKSGPHVLNSGDSLELDCDAFYASVEKRDQPALATRPVIVGGGTRGVVAACCYIARLSGVRSAMPMFKARAACPDAVVIKPDIAKYAREGARIRAMMEALTPLVQPLSIDEAVLDLRGTEALHNAPPAAVLARFAQAVEREVGVTVSVGLAANRLMAKLAAERDKPRGFAVIGAGEAAGWLAPQSVAVLPGVGPAMAKRLASAGFVRLGQLAALDARAALARFGADGPA
ncbi:MAG: hydantoinase B/oxoprolinase family protein, partial [Alphaproteobacteria bacterium]